MIQKSLLFIEIMQFCGTPYNKLKLKYIKNIFWKSITELIKECDDLQNSPSEFKGLQLNERVKKFLMR